MRKLSPRHALIAPALCLLLGIGLLATPLRFSGALLIGLAVLLLLWSALTRRKAARRTLAALLIIGFFVFAAA